MKRLIAIILSCVALSVNATKVYVSSTGSDATGNGSLSNPYALVSYACTQASAGDTVFVLAGTIDQGTTQIVKPVGVSILGEGNTSIIITNFTHTSALQAAIQCASTAGSTTNDNSSISHIRLNGNNLTASRAIYVGYRNNINIHNCTIEDFNVSGIYLDASQDTYPDLFLTGISIHDCVINNCADRTVGYDGCIRARGTDGLQIYNLLIDMTSRPTGNNGISIAAYRNKRMKIHNNVFHRNDHEITSTGVHRWNFFFEEHAGRGENDFYNNTLYGLAKISIGGISKRDNDCSYLWKVRYNNFLNNANGNRNYNGGEQTIYCINIEGDGKNGVEVSYNFIQRFAIGIELSTPTSGGGSFWQQNWSWTGISVHHNIIENCGYADFLYGSFGLWWINESNVSPFSGSFSNILISNNVMTGNNGGSYNSHTGIRIDGNSSITGLHVVNNIVIGFQNNIHVGDHGTDGVVYNNLQITHNLGHLNGSSDISVEAGASIVYNNCDTSTGNITADPQFASTTTYELSSSSPAIDAGIDVGFPYKALAPDIGAKEFSNYVTYYISPSGSNTAGNGTSSNPWQTPAYAISQASAGDTIFFQAGIYQITTQIEVPRAISLYTNEDATIIAGTALNPMFILQSTTQGTDGNQRISGLKFDGDITALSCFSVRRRSNVVFDSCTFIDFLYTAIEIYGGESFTDVPNNFITGFKILNCTIDNCCSRRDPQPFGAIRMGGTEGSEIAYNYLRQVGRNTGENGNLMYLWGAVNRGLYYHHNTSIKPTTDGTVSGNAGGWNFHIESGSSSGYEICYNEFIGGLAIDLAGGIQVKGDYDYAWYIHDNEFSIENQITALPSGTHRPGALDFERTNEDIIVTRNKFINYPTAINLTLSSSAYHYSRITFSYNIFENVGYSDNSYSYGGLQFVGNEAATGDLCSDINILNNTFYGNGARSFILLQQPYNMNNIYIRNNIFLNAVIWGYIIAWDVVGVSTTPTGSLTGFYIDNNLLYNNASNNGIYYRNAKTMTIESYANNIISEPQFVSISTFELSPSSPAIDAGIDVGLTRDFHNRRLVGVPDIGAIEYGAIGGERFGKNRQGVMLKGRNGRMMIYN